MCACVMCLCVYLEICQHGQVFDVNGTSLMAEETASTSKTDRVSQRQRKVTTTSVDHDKLPGMSLCVSVCNHKIVFKKICLGAQVGNRQCLIFTCYSI